MPNPPANWYPDPENPNRLRWWTGSEWSSTFAARPGPVAQAAVPAARRLPVAVIVVGLVAVIVGIIGLATSGFGGLLIMLGLVAFGVAVAAVLKGAAPSFRIKSRRAGLGALAGSFAIVVLGGAIAPHAEPLPGGTAQIAAAPEASASAEPSAIEEEAPVVVTRQETTTATIPFAATTVDDPALAAGTTTVTVVGVPGVRTTVWSITYADGDETKRVKVSEEVTTPPVDQVTAIGSYVAPPPPPPAAPSCDPNYGGCVPIASDVDCPGGSGNGPAYASGPVAVIGSDIYGLDRDGNGIGCD